MPDASTMAAEGRRAAAELMAFLGARPRLIAAAPRGDGRPVLVLPGLFGNDLYLGPMHGFLAAIGYRPVISRIGLNAGCPRPLAAGAMNSLLRAAGSGPAPVAIIGHSRGGMLGWAIAAELGARVSHLVLLGSPAPSVARAFREAGVLNPGAAAAPGVVAAGDTMRRILSPDCNLPECGCSYVEALGKALSSGTRVASIYATDDPVVRPEACVAPGVAAFPIAGSHGGLAHNPDALRLVAGELGEGRG